MCVRGRVATAVEISEGCHHDAVTLPPTLDEAIRLIRSQYGSITVGDLADAVIARGWKVDREPLVARIRELFPDRKADPSPAPSSSQPKPSGKKAKRPKSTATQDYCPKCHAFVVMTRLNGVTTVADHVAKKGGRCAQSGKPFTPKTPLKSDALEFRVPGSFGTGKRR